MGQTFSRVSAFFTSGSEQPSAVSHEEAASRHSADVASFTSPTYPLATPRSPLCRTKRSSSPSPDLTRKSQTKRPKRDFQYLDFPFLKDDFTINFVQKSKVMFILKGPPGSGKSFISQMIQEVYEDARVCSADQYFMQHGLYQFDREKLKDAHEYCQQQAAEAAKQNTHVIVIDNNNLQHWEMKFYLNLARACLYIPVVVEPQTPWAMTPSELAVKNAHEIPMELIANKAPQSTAAATNLALLSYHRTLPPRKYSLATIHCGRLLLQRRRQSTQVHHTPQETSPRLTSHQHTTVPPYVPGNVSPLAPPFPFVGDSHRRQPARGLPLETYHTRPLVSPRLQPVLEIKSYQPVQPIYYGWFLNDRDSEEMKSIGWSWFQQALGIQDFVQEFLQAFQVNSTEDLLNLFAKDSFIDGGCILHATSKFTARGKVMGAKEYITDPLVRNSIGKGFRLCVIGFVLTTRTIGARLKLTHEQLDLWSNDDQEDPPVSVTSSWVMKEHQLNHSNSEENKEKIEVSKHRNTSGCVPTAAVTETSKNEDRFYPTSGKGSRAHLTLACAPGNKPVTTGFDLILAVRCEQKALECKDKEIRSYDIDGGILQNCGEGIWVVYPDSEVSVSSLFSAFH
ncbi:NEDD4-binding protein 2-like 1 [Chionoecetes opilio]|uniref:2',3'-cyclic-nucleotide 3'-phosphodiesterase n=1 Tax=Chionoecetes opilio TaxID=41210 RepID=A0A8J5CKB6_CHIOP|nr:NEDD4-binding protein 2-like 1 [Chionoecetes opilio]